MAGSATTIDVLHVDDDPELCDLVATYLERVEDRLDVRTVNSTSDALDYLGTEDVDCVVSDYDMPESDGIEFLEAVRERHPDLPFVLYTGKGSEEVASDAISAGATDYLRKQSGSENYELLANRIVNAVEKTRSKGRASRFKRIAELVRTIQSALVSATTSEEIDAAVCETLADAEPYRFVWIGDVAPDRTRVTPRAMAGSDADGVDGFALDRDERRCPIESAIENRSVEVIDVADEDVPLAARIDGAVRSLATVPLVYDEEEYGVLTLYADRANAYGPEERELLMELGETIAHALDRVALQEQYEDQYRELFEDAPVMFVFTRAEDGELVIEECNRQFAETLGYSSSELRGRRVAEFYTDESRRKLQEGGGYERALAGEFVAEERDLVTRDGGRISTILRASPRRNEDGAIVGTNSLYVDVTHRERLEAVSQHRRELRQILDLIPDYVFAKDEDGSFVLVNEAIADLFATTPEEMIGKTDFDMMDDEAARAFREDDREVLETNTPKFLPEETLEGADGDTRILETRKIPFTIAGTDTSAVLGYGRDVTELKERERVLKEIYRLISDPDRSFEQKVDGLLEIGADTLELSYGSYATVDGQEYTVSVARTPGDGDVAGEVVPLSSTVCKRVVHDGESVAIGDVPTEAPKLAESAGKPVEGVAAYLGTPVVLDDEVAGVLCFFDTEPRADGFSEWEATLADLVGQWVSYERSRERLTADLAGKNERLQEFARIVSHDLRNPLNVAEGRLELAREECDSEHLEDVARAHDRMASLIEDVLSLAQNGEHVADVEPVELSDVADNSWRNVATDGATLGLEADLTLEADESRLQRLFENLMRNAVEHGGEGVEVRVETHPDGFSVADDGPGIPESEQDAVFETGYTTRSGNNGLGLNIVEGIADAHGWSIDVGESEAGGARFTFTDVDTA